MFNGNGQKLVGDDGDLKLATVASTVDGDGLAALPVGTYIVTTVAGSSGFPAPALGGTTIEAGDTLEIKTGISVIPEVGDTVVELTLTDKCDISDWSMEFTKEEIEVTTLCDLVKVYVAGKPDMSGTMNGVYTVGTTDDTSATAGIMRQFIDIVKQDGGTSYDKFSQTEQVLLAFLYANSKEAKADPQYVVAPIQLYGFGLGGEIGSNQGFASPFRFGNLTITDDNAVTVEVRPTFYRLGDGT